METAVITTNKGFVNGAHPMHIEHAEEDEPNEMAQDNKLTLPSWVMPLMVTIVIAFVGNLGASMYWAGQIATNQANTVEQIKDLKTEVYRLRADNQSLREEVIGLKAMRQQR